MSYIYLCVRQYGGKFQMGFVFHYTDKIITQIYKIHMVNLFEVIILD